VHVIPTGVDVDRIQSVTASDPRPAAGWPPDAIVAVSLGRLAPEKSPMTVLEAVALAGAGDARLRLLVIGGGPSEAGLRTRAARPDLAGRVAFTGMLPRSEALAQLRGGDLFVFASRTETQGLVLAEALSAGLPAVAVDGPGVRDSVRDGVDGIIVAALPETDRAERVASAISALVGVEAQRDRMAERAAGDAGRFSVDGRVGETEALYRTLLT
jgi:glycosyltransferase involved in cell wall biosynthesis